MKEEAFSQNEPVGYIAVTKRPLCLAKFDEYSFTEAQFRIFRSRSSWQRLRRSNKPPMDENRSIYS